MTRRSLSLAIIAKNEEQNLRNCLASVARFVDEIVVVDTGSTDGTRAVATSFGASVIDFSPRTHPDAFFLDDEETCRKFGYDLPGSYSNQIAFADFAAARNVSFDHCRGDFVLWVDSDDVVEGAENLPQVVAELDERGLHMGFLAYDYARDHLGRVFYRQWRERIVRRGVARWVNDVHEVLLPSQPIIPARFENVKLSHRRKADRPGTPNRNYKILLRMLARDYARNPGAPPDPRTLFYLGQEARFVEPMCAVGFYENYLKVSGWGEERAAAHVALGTIYEFGMIPGMPPDEAYNRANREFAAAAAEMPSNPDGLLGMARIAHLRSRWADCVAFTERAFAIGNTDSMLGANPMDRLYRPHVYYNHALARLGRLEEALASCRKGLEVCPDDPGVPGGASGMLTYNVKFYESELAKPKAPPPVADGKRPVVEFDKSESVDAPPVVGIPRDALVIWSMQLWKQIVFGGGTREQASAFLDSLPREVQLDEAVARMRAATARRFVTSLEQARELVPSAVVPPKPDDLPTVARWVPCGAVPANARELAEGVRGAAVFSGARDARSTGPRVVFYVGAAFQPWDPTTPDRTGIGGSETACIEMARELAALGCDVTVYGDCAATEGIYDGVRYHHHDKFPSPHAPDVLISSRRPDVSDPRARLNLLWVHDIHVGPPVAPMETALLRFDRILCLSSWHKQFFLSCYPTLHPDRVVVTRNGIRPARFSASPVKRGNRMIFSSSPNRGLDTLLANFPFIKDLVPDAQIDICYGFEAWETFARMRGDAAELAEIDRYKRLIEQAVAQGHAVYHGRVPQTRLAELMLGAKVWSYPTAFLETSCITAMEAQAAGAVPVTSAVAALPETVKHGFLVEPGPNYGRKWVDAVVGMLSDEYARSRIAAAGRAHALENLSWSALARDWLAMFERLAVDVARNPIAPWKEAA